ncbi:MAG: M56 family metallopeptidase [Pirellulales bacterium]
MSDDAVWLLSGLLRTTVLLTAAALAALALLRWARPAWTAAHRTAWLLVLLVGWTFWQWPVAVPWHDPPLAEPVLRPEAAAAPSVVAVPDDVERVAFPVSVATAPAETEFLELKPANVAGAPPEAPQFVELKAVEFAPDAPARTASLPSTSAAEGTPAFDWAAWAVALVALWLAGIVCIAAAWCWGYARFVRLLNARRAADEDWQREWQAVAAGAGLRPSIPLSLSDRFGPMLCRLPRGYELIVPAGLWRSLDGAGRRAILRHELAHYQRGDVWKSLGARFLALPHWFNPLAWLAVRRFEEAAEWACDRAATADVPATEYAKVLLSLGQLPPSFGYGSAARGRPLAARVRRVLAGEQPQDSALKKALLLAAAACLVGISIVQVRLVAREPAPAADAKNAEPKVADPADTIELKESADPPASGLQPDTQPPTPSLPPETPPAATPLNALQEKMLEQAERSYEAHMAAFEAETVTMPTVYDWSLRWKQAAQALAKDHAGRVQAVQNHVDRMRNLQQKIKVLYEIGNRGGEAKDYAAANFYLAEAERELAEVEASGQRADEPQLRAAVPATLSAQADSRDAPSSRVPAELAVVDLEIKIAELRGQLEQADVQIDTKKKDLDHLRQGAGSALELNNAQGELKALVLHERSLEQQLKLHEQKLKLVKSLGTATPETPKAYPMTLPGPTAKPSLPGQTATERVPLYGGRRYHEWVKVLHEDLSPERRTEALHALAAFAGHGYAEQATREIFEAMRAHSVRYYEGDAQGLFEQAAVQAFEKFPAGVVLPVLREALRSTSANERMFAAAVSLTPSVAMDPAERIQALRALLKDPEVDVRRYAAVMLHSDDPEAPEMVDVLRDWLKVNDWNEVYSAVNVLTASWRMQLPGAKFNPAEERLLTTLMPDVLALMDRPEPIGAQARQTLTGMSATWIVPSLDAAAKSEDAKTRQHAEEVLKAVLANAEVQSRMPIGAVSAIPTFITPASQAAVPTVPARRSAAPSSQRVLLYGGRDFDAWAEDLRSDLSPQQRTEAIKALATFAANGYGRQAAQEIVNAMQGYSIWMRDNSPVGQLKEAALAAFQPSALDPATIPPADARPVVLEALKSNHNNQRLFAAAVLPTVVTKRDERVALLAPLLKDRDELVRRYAVDLLLGEMAPETPGIAEVLHEALQSQDDGTFGWAKSAITRLLALSVPGGPHAAAANKVLEELGPDVIRPALEQIAKPTEQQHQLFTAGGIPIEVVKQAQERLNAPRLERAPDANQPEAPARER